MEILFNNQEYISVFFEEMEEQLQILDRDIKELMIFRENREELIDEIFRVTHTLKGSAASYGFEQISELSHAMEDVLAGLRKTNAKINMQIIDLFFECLEGLGKLKASGVLNEENFDTADLLARLRNCALLIQPISDIPVVSGIAEKKKTGLKLTSYEKERLLELGGQGRDIYEIHISFEEDCFMKSLQGFLALNNLREIGDVFKSSPTIEELEKDEIENSLAVIFVTNKGQDKIRKLLDDVTEIKIDEISRLDMESLKLNRNGKKSESKKFIRVKVNQVNHVINLVEKILTGHKKLQELMRNVGPQHVDNIAYGAFNEAVQFLISTGEELQGELQGVKKLSLKKLLQRFGRMIDKLAIKYSKKINFLLEGDDANLESGLVKEIDSLITHLVRNAVTHGIESPEERLSKGKNIEGNIKINIWLWKNLIITVEDDGHGMDSHSIFIAAKNAGYIDKEESAMSNDELIELVFRPGISTQKDADDIAGRGVGLDAVKEGLAKINGNIEIDTRVGEGTKFTLAFKL